MNAPTRPESFALDAYLLQQENKSLLRFVTCGSVDHGKSTLIGRLLYGANGVFDDQLGALRSDSRKHGTQGEELDFSLLLDGLAAEREQKITIDVAYRFFSTANRKFIVADTPGHEQYTRNMATGASTADVALILVDAASGLRPQTRRHTLIVSTVGVRRIALVVNKMDKVAWSEAAFRAIEREYRAVAASLAVDEIVCIPVAARAGDNVVTRSRNMNWYRGPTLLDYLETVEVAQPPKTQSFRLPVQWINRPDADFRGACGMVAGGHVHPGMAVTVLPSGRGSQVARIVTYDGDLAVAGPGQSVTLTLRDEIDVSRGDVIAAADRPPTVTDRLKARIVWMSEAPLVAGRSYLLKLGASSTNATTRGGLRVLDLASGRERAAAELAMNDIGHAEFVLDRRIALDAYADNRATGAFILIDRDSYDTVAMGTVERERSAGLARRLRDILLARHSDRAAAPLPKGWESHVRSIAKAVSWRATGSIDTFLLTLLITGSGAWAGSIAGTEIVTKIVAYYFHERIWSFVRWGRP
jgi:sulfate adenylyltransferase large subunit